MDSFLLTQIKRTVEVDNEILERGVAKERVAMFKNLQSGAQPSSGPGSIDSKIRVDVSNHFSHEFAFLNKALHFLETLSFHCKTKDFRWHVNVCQPINGSILRRRCQTSVCLHAD